MSKEYNTTLGQILDDTTAKYPDKDAVVYVRKGLRWTYSQFSNEVMKVAKGLHAMGIKKGDHVSVWATNVPEWVVLQFATAKIGAVLVTVNTNYKSHELEYILKQSDSTTLFLIGQFRDCNYVETAYDVMPEIKGSKPGELSCEKLPFMKNVIYIGDEKHNGMFNFSDLIEMGKDISDETIKDIQASLSPHDTINMQYTSGTTGFPKGVMLTHHNISNNAYNVGSCMDFTDQDKLCIPVPFFHCFGCVMSTLLCVIYGATMVPVEIYNPDEVLEAVEKEKCTALHGVPTMFIMELNSPNFKKYDLSSLRTGIMAGAPCPIEIMKRVMDEMHMTEVTIAYGQTEASPVVTQTRTNDNIERRVSTVGRSLPNMETKIVDPETGKTLSPGVQGEFCSRGYQVMKGYYKMEEQTAKTIDSDGWLHSGDLAVVDEHGYYKITGRIKNMIIRGGENIFPREIEEFYFTHPKIMDVQVLGVPDIKYGEQIYAAIKIKEGETLTEKDLRLWSADKIARHKVPKYFKFVTEYPMTASGKVQKFKLREFAIKELNLETAENVKTA